MKEFIATSYNFGRIKQIAGSTIKDGRTSFILAGIGLLCSFLSMIVEDEIDRVKLEVGTVHDADRAEEVSQRGEATIANDRGQICFSCEQLTV